MKNLDPSSDASPKADLPADQQSAPLSPATRVGNAGDSAYTVMGLDAEIDAPSPDRFVGGKIGKYEIRKLLGQGGMGAVYLAFDPLIEREVALKILSTEVGNNAAALQRFLGEARAIGRLNSPHVVAIFDIDQWEGQYYIVMELLSGGSVADLDQPTPWNVACQIVLEAARGLHSAHSAGMIHRDIKPENLMLTGDGLVKVVDFGLSKLIDAASDTRTAVTRAGQILGTPQYMSPEQFESANVDARTDIYSLGGTLFRLLTGRFPYHDCQSIVQVMTAHVKQPPPAPTQFAPNVPEACNVIIARAMAKNPADRYQTAADLAADLQSLLQLGTSSVSETQSVVDEQRELATVLIVEPSKLQAAILKDGFMRCGARSVEVFGSTADATRSIEQQSPDLLITAMELTDGQGIDLLRRLSQAGRLRRTTAVLNTNESRINELASIDAVPCVLLAPKKVKAAEIQTVVEAAGSLSIGSDSVRAGIDTTTHSLRIVLDTGALPGLLADLLRQSGLLNVDVVMPPATASSPANLTLYVHSLATADVDSTEIASLAKSERDAPGLAAVVQADRNGLTLRAVARGGVVGLTRRPLDLDRLHRLLRSSRS